MNNMSLPELAQYFAKDCPHKDLALTINDLPRKSGDEYCPYCLGTAARQNIMKAIGPPEGEDATYEDFFRCHTCNTTFAKDERGGLWRVADA